MADYDQDYDGLLTDREAAGLLREAWSEMGVTGQFEWNYINQCASDSRGLISRDEITRQLIKSLR